MSKMMWNQVESLYRGQATRGTVVTVDDDAMIKALNKAGNTVFDTDWWVETVQSVLEHWGLASKRWMDPATQMPRVHYCLEQEQAGSPDTTTRPNLGTKPINIPSMTPTGPLSARLNSGKLATGDLKKK